MNFYLTIKNRIISIIVIILSKSYNIVELSRLIQSTADNNGNANSEKNGEYKLLKQIIKLSNNNSYIIDVGSNTGIYSLQILRYGFKGNLILIDPLESNMVISKKLIDYDKVNYLTTAVSDEEGMDIFYINTDKEKSGLDSLYNMQDIGYNQETEKINVKISKIDNILNNLNINQVFFLKIDVEGNEYKVLKGAINYLTQNKIRFIQFEFGNAAKAARVYLHDIVNLLNIYNYNIYIIMPNGIKKLHL